MDKLIRNSTAEFLIFTLQNKDLELIIIFYLFTLKIVIFYV